MSAVHPTIPPRADAALHPPGSLRLRLLAPLVLGCAVMLAVGCVVIHRVAHAEARTWLERRAEVIARAVTMAAGSSRSPEELDRLVRSLGQEHGVTVVVAVGGDPPSVLASTRDEWRGRSLADLPEPSVGEDLRSAIVSGRAGFGDHAATGEIDCTLPFAGPADAGQGAVMVHIDSAELEASASRLTWLVAWVSVVLGAAAVLGMWIVLRRTVLRPIGRLMQAIDRDVEATGLGGDELGLLAAAFNAHRAESHDARHRLESALHEVRFLWSALDRHSILSVAGPDGRIIEANTGFCEISGYSRAELLGQDHRLLNSGVHPKSFWVDVWRRIATGRAWRGEICNRAKDGHLYWVDSTIIPWLGPDGRVERYLSIRFEITAQKLAAEERHRAAEAAEAANRAKSEFLANMSHEIRTPMTAILGYADLLSERDGQCLGLDERRAHLNTIRRNGEHLLEIINDILDLSKIEAGKMDVQRAPVDPRAILAGVSSLMAMKAAAKGLSLRVEQETPLPATVSTDALRLRQILVNLVGNAIKFTEHGSVTVRAALLPEPDGRGAGPRLRLTVADTGIGMTGEQQGRLFGAFEQVDGSMTRRFGGTGLGLRISRSLAQMLGGDITVESEPGRGSTFTVTIAAGSVAGIALVDADAPIPEAGGPRAVADDAGAQPLGGARILLVEDGPDNQRLVSFVLGKAGAAVAVCDNGRMALERLSRGGHPDAGLVDPAEFDIVLTDMQMPELDGYALARALRAGGWRGPIIALTAHAMEGDSQKCFDAGCDGYASKPVDRTKLVAICVEAYRRTRRESVIARAA